jgi:hypothetical protein
VPGDRQLEVESEPGVLSLPASRVLLADRLDQKTVSVVVGSPYDRMQLVRTAESTIFPAVDLTTTALVQQLGFATNPAPPSAWPKTTSISYSPDIHRFLEYTEVLDVKTQRPLGLLEPAGMSGGGIWVVPVQSEGGLWSADRAVLAGIQVGLFKEQRLLSGVRMRPWLDLMRHAHPDLIETIDQLDMQGS